MELSWAKCASGDIDLYNGPKVTGWIEHRAGGRYSVHIKFYLSEDEMPCEETAYATLREAMRALKSTVTVLMIGRGYED